MYENIFIFTCDKSKAFSGVEPFYLSLITHVFPCSCLYLRKFVSNIRAGGLLILLRLVLITVLSHMYLANYFLDKLSLATPYQYSPLSRKVSFALRSFSNVFTICLCLNWV